MYYRAVMACRWLLSSALGVWLLTQPALSHADPAAAEALFREGRALMDRGELAAACEKLEASNELDASAGTLLNLAVCRQKQGKTASAWAYFVAAERLARKQGRADQASEAERRASELEPRLSTLTLLAPAAPPGLELRRDGKAVQIASLGSPVPVDPGPLVIEASAPGYESVKLELSIGSAADRRTLEIPPLEKVTSAAAPSPSPPPSLSSAEVAKTSRSPSVLPWVIGGVGAATLAAGSVLGVMAVSSDSKAIAACDRAGDLSCDGLEKRRNQQALAASVCVGVGVVGVGVAAIWLLTGHSGRPASAWSYHGEVTRESALLQMRARF